MLEKHKRNVYIHRMRTMNRELLASWATKHGDLAREDLAYMTRIKFHTIRRIMIGEKMPTELEQTAICEATQIPRDALFPVCETERAG